MIEHKAVVIQPYSMTSEGDHGVKYTETLNGIK